MKKILGLILTALVLIGGIGYIVNDDKNISNQELSFSDKTSEAILILDFGDRVATYSAEIGDSISVLDFLKKVGEDNYKIEIKEYDFGSLVVGIDGYKNTMEKSWIYFVNGKSSEVSAGDKLVESKDLVEWKYIKPIF